MNPAGKLALKMIKHLAKMGGTASFAAPSWYADRGHIPANGKTIAIRIIPGRQYSSFTAESQEQLCNQLFTITTQSDRMGYRLSGTVLKLEKHLEMISEAVALGTILIKD
jgi:antagonist of KipI